MRRFDGAAPSQEVKAWLASAASATSIFRQSGRGAWRARRQRNEEIEDVTPSFRGQVRWRWSVAALAVAALAIKPGDTVLLYTDHYRRAFGTDDWHHGPGLSTEAARWLGQHKIAAFGVEPASPGVRHVSNQQVHHICG
ncbi:MAG: cyclase family protein, partial [Planctomycetaceae bacterium]|nr:cyclase family protein [Planctomycetaceae bacterium]